MRCLSCKYDLKHLTVNRCPECGREFDPADARTFDPSTMSPATRLAIRITIIVVLFIGLLAGIAAIIIYYLFSSALRNYHP